MAGNGLIHLVSWDGATWAWTRARPGEGAEVFSIEGSTLAAEAGTAFPPEFAAAAKQVRRGPLILVDTALPLMVKEVTVPLVAEDKQAATIEGEVARSVPFPLAEVVWDAVVLEEDAIEQRLLLVAARQAEWEPRHALVAQAWRPARSETLPVALQNLLPRLADDPEAPAVVVYPGREASVLIFLGGGAGGLRIARSGVAEGDAAAWKRLHGECTRAVAAHRRQFPTWQPGAVWLAGPAVDERVEDFGPLAGIEPRVWDATRLAARAPIGGLETVPADHRWAVAGALLGVSGEPYGASHLRPAAERARSADGLQAPWLWAAAALLVIAGLSWLWPSWQTRGAVQGALAELRRERAPIATYAAELDALGREAAREEAAIAGIADLARSRANWTNFLVDLQSRLGAVENVWIDALEVLREGPVAAPRGEPTAEEEDLADAAEPTPSLRLRLRGRLLDPANPLQRVSPEMRARVNDLIDGLAGSEYVMAVADKRFETLEGGLLQFTFTLTINPERRL